MNKTLFNRIQPNYKAFQNKKLFVDCSFQINSEEIYAHRIILSHFSTLFKDYFKSIEFDPSNIMVQVPFNINNEFSQLINFFYEKQFSTDMNYENLIDFYAVSNVYGVPSLSIILKDLIFRGLSVKNVLQIVDHYQHYSYDQKILKSFPTLKENFEKMMNSSADFAEFIARNFDSFDRDTLLRALTPKLLSETLKISKLDDNKIMELVDRYYELKNCAIDTSELQSLIKWDFSKNEDREDPYILFSKYKADWVDSSISRQLISRLLEKRRKTLKCFEKAVENVKDFCNNWYIFTWITEIRESLGQEEIIEIDLMNFIGTLGGASNYFNPMFYQLVQPYCSASLQVPQYNRLLFDQEAICDQKKYFLSYPYSEKSSIIPYAGYLFNAQSFVPTILKIYFVENKPKPLSLEAIGYDESDNIIYQIQKNDIDVNTEYVQIETNNNQPIKKIVVKQHGLNSAGGRIFRIKQLEVHGHFVPG